MSRPLLSSEAKKLGAGTMVEATRVDVAGPVQPNIRVRLYKQKHEEGSSWTALDMNDQKLSGNWNVSTDKWKDIVLLTNCSYSLADDMVKYNNIWDSDQPATNIL